MRKIIVFLFTISINSQAQIGINTTNPEAQLDIRSSNQAAPSNTDGILIPKIDAFPAINPTAAQQGMLVYLTTPSGTDMSGFYYWDNNTLDWKPIAGASLGTLDQAYDFGGAGLGKTITADAGAITINGTDGLVSTGIYNSGALAPSGGATKMVWNPRKAAFRAGRVFFNEWDDINIGFESVAFGNRTKASGSYSSAFGWSSEASGIDATAFGLGTKSANAHTFAAGYNTEANGILSTVFGDSGIAPSYGETVLGIGATTYTPTSGGNINFQAGNVNDRLFVIGNAIDANANFLVENSERSDAMIVLKNGLTRLPSTTNAMITAADGKAVVTKEYLQSNSSGSLDQAYDFGGAGLGGTITADTGAVTINGTDGLVSTGTFGFGAVSPSGDGIKMVWNPRKAAFRAGFTNANGWDDINIGDYSVAFNEGTRSMGRASFATGGYNFALANYGQAAGYQNTSFSYGETVLGIGATFYTSSLNGTTQFRTANETDRLFVIGNAIDANNNTVVDNAERSDAMVVLKNGLTRLPSTTNAMITAADGKAVVTKEYLQSNNWSLTGNTGTNPATNFIGTTDNVDLVFRRNNIVSGKIDETNTFLGTNSGIVNTGLYNTFIGERAGIANATGDDNTFIGRLAGANGTFGNDNSYLGYAAGLNNTGNSNLILGAFASQNTSGSFNVFVGNLSAGTNTTGSRNTVLGHNAEVGVGNLTNATAIGNNSQVDASNSLVLGSVNGINGATASVNVGIGTTAPTENLHVSGPAGLTTVRIANTSGTGATSNVALEFFRNTAVNTDWRIYNIGANLTVGNSGDDLATVNDLYQFQGARFMPMNDGTQSLGQAANRWSTVFATNGTINTSDRREKKEIQPLRYGLNQLMQLKPVSFKWNNSKIDNDSKHLGFIAQDLQEVLPEVVIDSEWVEENDNKVWKKAPLLGVNYTEVIPVLVQSIQEQQAIIEVQKKEIENQKATLQTVLQRLAILEKIN